MLMLRRIMDGKYEDKILKVENLITPPSGSNVPIFGNVTGSANSGCVDRFVNMYKGFVIGPTPSDGVSHSRNMARWKHNVVG